MTNHEYAMKLISLYTALYEIEQYKYDNIRKLFHECLEDNDIEFSVVKYEYDENHQSGRYVIIFNDDFFVMNVESKHHGYIKWSIENE